ncbi:MAG: DNA polymerase III subunit delta' [Brevibacterium aurantiacum]|uniref:DNA polymerase III subunit delta n=1 Tax=Brevibacterium aurantiacum TaxID=273384 RepID=A0A2H1I1N9_BREAU|nr:MULTISPECIES: DNA polymerase III subunit delta' [Brevibacterium]MDN5586849.1 DNA polymerase III subunit delta' [Brevibacterium sp.]AZL04991.1 DNA polymerase III subunit delta' [Brevibacterium aurantiacum]AZL12190.1 DNA polymerase III subunit delta' [Brevibacterium aurantiacum]AZT96415.1 DNA polymerase III subunit delta' [Brevibacterium aurantiacum]MDN5658206.1 DNA polymerase III subunit delta' [Brevibacterium sandarakinum]
MSVFNELVGQDDVITQLEYALHSPGAMTHAWLFTGPPGSGRSNAARAFAAALISGGEEPNDVTARVLKGHHESLTIMSTQKSVITIDEVRELVTKAQSAPVNSPWRVVIIEDADRMSERTANVLLKAIEEPPPATVWLLCAPSPIDVLTTIRSRCRPVRLRIPSRDAVAKLLIERDHIDEDRAKWAAAVAQNHIGRAKYMALNESAGEERKQILAIPGKLTSVGATIRLAGRIVDEAAETAKSRVEERNATERTDLMATLGIESEKSIPPSARSQIRKLEEEQKRRSVRARNDELDRIFLELMSLYRDILMHQLGIRDGWINAGEGDLISEQANRDGPDTTLLRIDAITEARRRLQTNMSPVLIVESAFVLLSNPWLLEDRTGAL